MLKHLSILVFLYLSFVSRVSLIQCNCANIFPKDFQFGVATASYQVEGAANVSGKGVNIWDYSTHIFPEFIVDRSNGDIACDSYHKVAEDIKNLKKLGVHYYRISLSWSRILPTGFTNRINPDGIRYYNELIDTLIENNIEPWVTIYHFDLPQSLQDLGGWTNRETVEHFAGFARICFQYFGDRVKTWITINEPYTMCASSYEDLFLAPFIKSPGIGSYQCGHNLLLAHARAYKIYNEQFRKNQRGTIGITIESPWFEPASKSSEDVVASDRAIQTHFGWFTHPIFSKDGNYPAVLIRQVDYHSKKQNFTRSRLPKFSKQEIKLLQGSADFLGLNYYTTFLVSNKPSNPTDPPSVMNDAEVSFSQDPSWPKSARDVFRDVPWGLGKLLNYIKDKYRNPKVLITEIGYAGFQNETVDDTPRIDYYIGHLNAVVKTIREDKCNVNAFTVWSYIDNFEWSDGYTKRFGLYYVDFEDPERKRTPKKSAYFFQRVINTRKADNFSDFDLSSL